MRRCVALLLLSLLMLAKNAQGVENEDACDWRWRTIVYNGTVMDDGSLLSLEDGNVYPEGTFWFEENGEVFFACPCMLNNCIRICKTGYFEHSSVNLNRSKTTVLDENNEHTLVVIEDHFEEVHQNAECSNPQLLTPEENERDRFQLLSNGTLYFPTSKVAKVPRMLRPFQFCIIPMAEPEVLRVATCLERYDFTGMLFVAITCIFLFTKCINLFFMLLIVIAYFLSADLKSLHGRALASYAASLVLEDLFRLFRDFPDFHGTSFHKYLVCIPFAYFIYFISAASMFWLNMLCLDMCQMFKGFLTRRREENFIYPSLYAWGGPALLTIIVLILDLTTNDEKYSPRIIAAGTCSFSGYQAHTLYVFLPKAILLSVNLVLFCLTARQLCLQRRETKRAFRDTTSGRVNARDNDLYKLYLKLFLLMAFTSVNVLFLIISITFNRIFGAYFREIVSLIENLKGPLFFWLLIWSRKNVRKEVTAALTCCRKKPNEVLQMNLSMESTTSKDFSNVSTINNTSA